MRIVLDTNILISSLISRHTPPDQLYQAWRRNEFELVTSPAQIEEVARVLARPKSQRFVNPDEATALTENINAYAIFVEYLPEISVSPDPKDNPILATAIAGQVDLIVSGDKGDLIELGNIKGIPIMTPRDAVRWLALSN